MSWILFQANEEECEEKIAEKGNSKQEDLETNESEKNENRAVTRYECKVSKNVLNIHESFLP